MPAKVFIYSLEVLSCWGVSIPPGGFEVGEGFGSIWGLFGQISVVGRLYLS